MCGGTSPLICVTRISSSIYSGKLLICISPYGKKQNDGWNVAGNSVQWEVPARPFIEKLAGEKATKIFSEQIKKSFKK